MPLCTNHFVEDATCHYQKVAKKKTWSLTYKTETNSASDGQFVLLYFQHQEVTWKNPTKPGFHRLINSRSKIWILQSLCLDGKRNWHVIVYRISEYTKDQCHDNAARRQHALQADSSPVWPKQDFQQQTFLRTLFARLDNELSICLKGRLECEGQLKRLTRPELPKHRENKCKLAFKNVHK